MRINDKEIVLHCIEKGFLADDVSKPGERFRLVIEAGRVEEVLRVYGLLEKCPVARIFSQKDFIPPKMSVFKFIVMDDDTVCPSKIPRLMLSRRADSLDLIKLNIWAEQSDAIMSVLTEKMREEIRE